MGLTSHRSLCVCRRDRVHASVHLVHMPKCCTQVYSAVLSILSNTHMGIHKTLRYTHMLHVPLLAPPRVQLLVQGGHAAMGQQPLCGGQDVGARPAQGGGGGDACVCMCVRVCVCACVWSRWRCTREGGNAPDLLQGGGGGGGVSAKALYRHIDTTKATRKGQSSPTSPTKRPAQGVGGGDVCVCVSVCACVCMCLVWVAVYARRRKRVCNCFMPLPANQHQQDARRHS